jgi:hypothetical protein
MARLQHASSATMATINLTATTQAENTPTETSLTHQITLNNLRSKMQTLTVLGDDSQATQLQETLLSCPQITDSSERITPATTFTTYLLSESWTPDDPPISHHDTRHPKHNQLSWTACYTDSCQTHRSEKEGSGWYPRKPQKHGRRNRRLRPPQERVRMSQQFDNNPP